MKTAHKNHEFLLLCGYLACIFITLVGLGVWRLGVISKPELLYTVPFDLVVSASLYISATRNRGYK